MNEEDKRKGLTVIEGGKQPKGRTGKAESGLTLKQEEFAKQLANGASNSEAYRAAYNCDDMAQSTIHEHACRLATHDKIRARVEELLREKAARTAHVEAKNSDRIWAQVWGVLEAKDTPAAVKVSAATLAAKLSGMMVDKVEVKGAETAEAIERELLQRLAKYK